MIKPLRNKPNSSGNNKVVSIIEEGQRGFMRSSKTGNRCPSSVFDNTSFNNEDDALDYLASILVEIFLEQQENEQNKLK